MDEISNKSLLVLLICVVVISFGGTLISINKLDILRIPILTGYATSTPEGNISLEVTSTTSITFVTGTLDFNSGYVFSNQGICSGRACKMNTSPWANDSCCKGNWNLTRTNYEDPLVLENDGNVNVTLKILSNATPLEFIGGTVGTIEFKIKVENNETGACGMLNSTYSDWFTPPDVSPAYICGNSTPVYAFDYDDLDRIHIHVQVSIPEDAIQGARQASLTVTGTGA